MISEKRFALTHTSFWNALLPRSEAYIRSRNLALERFAFPMSSSLPPEERGVVNEIAFRLFASSVELSLLPEGLPPEVVVRCSEEGFLHVRDMRQSSREPATRATQLGLREAKELARRLSSFYQREEWQSVTPRPRFPGCGWVSEAEGDVLASSILFEIKAGDRLFRGVDLRQVLAYCALNFASKTFGIVGVCLINPRRGVYLQAELEGLCEEVAGAPAAEVLGDVVTYISEPLGRYLTG